MKRIPLLLTAVIFTAGCGLYTACKKDCPTQPPPLPPGHTALTLTAKQISTRWLTLQWKNDSTAVSRAYVLLRNGKDTIYNATATTDTITVKDSSLTPSTTCNYTLYRIYQNQHWDSATAQVRMLDTTKDSYSWIVTRLGLPTDVFYAVWGTNPNSVWLGGGVDSGDIIHYQNGQLHFMKDIQQGIFTIYCISGTSDSDVWFGGAGVLGHWDGTTLSSHVFNGDSLPNVQHFFSSIYAAPNGEIFAAGDSGYIVHRKINGQWEIQQSGTTLALTSMRAFSPTNIYAAGGSSNYEGVLLHYDGSSWNTVLQSVLPDSSVKVANMAVGGDSPDSLYLVGNGVYHRKGTLWENRFTPTYYAECVASQGWNNVFVGGNYLMLIKFDGDHWVNINTTFVNTGYITAVTVLNGEFFAVGYDDYNAYFIHGQ